jgi:hypothetical protein
VVFWTVKQFYFHLYNDVTTLDDEGRSLPDDKSARDQATRDAREMAAESVRDGHLNLAHYIEVTGDDRRPLFRVTFGEVVEIIE